MKIAQIVSTFPPNIGGMGNVCRSESQFLSDSGHDVTVFTLKYPKITYDDSIYQFNVVRLQPLFRIGNAGVVPQISSMLKQFDLVHLHYPFYGLFLSGLCEKPLIISYQMDARPSGFIKKFLQKIYDSLFPRKMFAVAKKIIVGDKEYFDASRFASHIDKNKVIEIPNGVDTKVFKRLPVDLRDVNLEELSGKKILLFVANLMPLKRVDLAIKAMTLINDKNVRLVVVGGGNYLKKYKKMANDLGAGEKIFFMGSCPNDVQVSDYYNIADCLIMSSDYESFALVIVEAMACCLPVIGTDIPGIRNRIRDGVDGFLFKQGSAESLAERINQILAMPADKLKEMGEHGRSRVIEKYSWHRHMESLESLYQGLLAN